MADSGVYGALKSTPKLSEGFAAEGSFARIAEKEFRKKEAERAEQRQIAAEGRMAINNAVAAGNIDMGEINSSLQQTVGSVLDLYKSKILDVSKQWEKEPTFANQLKVTQVMADFKNKIGVIKGIGGTMDYLSSNKDKFSPVLSAGVYNGNMRFIENIVPMTKSFDPETMTVEINGKRQGIRDVYSGMVDITKLVPATKLDDKLDEFTDLFVNDDNKKVVVSTKGGKQITSVYYDIDSNTSRTEFDRVFSNTDELKELKAYALQRYEMGTDMEREDLIGKGYITIDKEGLPYANNDNVFNYVRDSRLRNPRVVGEKPIEPKEPTQSEIKRGLEQQDRFGMVDNIDSIYTNKGAEKLRGFVVNDGMRRGMVNQAKVSYNPETDENIVGLFYDYVDSKGVRREGVKEAQDDSDGTKQGIGKMIDQDYSYMDNKEAMMKDGSYTAKNKEGANLDNRMLGIKTYIGDNKWAVYDAVINAGSSESATYNAIYGDAASLIKNAGVPSLSSYFEDNFGQAEAFKTGDYVQLGGKTYDLEDEDKRMELSDRIGAMIVTAKNMEKLEMPEEDIKEALDKLASVNTKDGEFEGFSLDPLVREAAKNNYDMIDVNSMLIEGKSTKEIMNAINGGAVASAASSFDIKSFETNFMKKAYEKDNKGFKTYAEYLSALKKAWGSNYNKLAEQYYNANK